MKPFTNKNTQRIFFHSISNDNTNEETLKEMCKDSKIILWSGINAVNPRTTIKNLLLSGTKLQIKESIYDLSDYQNIELFGIGKTSSGMVYEVANMLHDINGGIEISKDDHATPSEIDYLTL